MLGGSRRTVSLALACAVSAGLAGVAVTATGAPPSRPTAIVSLGDSYISGQAGRWQGNSDDSFGSRAGTDRACVASPSGCRYDPGRVYLGGTQPPGCARSDVAEIRSAAIPVDERVNIACSGAVTRNLLRARSGGRSFKGEAPQADQLAGIASRRRVELIAVTIGGNDLGFASVVAACAFAYVSRAAPCNRAQQAAIEAKLPMAMAGVARVIDDIRAVMRSAGYRPWDYRLVLQGYPSALPRAAENRYPQAGLARELVGNCPFYDADSNWARDTIVPRIDASLEAVALRKRVQFMDLRDELQGREICSRSTRLADRSHPPSPVNSEWARFVGPSAIFQGGTIDEEVHPNAYGQQALGRCLTLLFARATGSWTCRNTPSRGTGSMFLGRISSVPGRFPLRLRASPRRVIAGRRRCFTFRALSGAEPVDAVSVRFAGRRGRTGRRGRVRECLRLRARSYRARASRRGFRSAVVTVRAIRP